MATKVCVQRVRWKKVFNDCWLSLFDVVMVVGVNVRLMIMQVVLYDARFYFSTLNLGVHFISPFSRVYFHLAFCWPKSLMHSKSPS